MATRRDFLKQAALVSGGAGLVSGLPPAVKRALAINPAKGSTFYDAEHVVILMQENRSFDHLFGCLSGVRGFNDPRAIRLPDGNLAWLQTDAGGRTYLPFRLDIRDTRATWMSSLPHAWASQVAARHGGRHDHWLEAKRSGKPEFRDLPLTMGYYDRRDLPFYYALADAFTVCDQYFCSSLTGTTPNRLFLWTGTLRAEARGSSPANVDNADVSYHMPASWHTFPEKLEALGVSWKVYQNELSVPVGFTSEEEGWLANFTDNPLEWFTQYHVAFLPSHVAHLRAEAARLEAQLQALQQGSAAARDIRAKLTGLREQLEHLKPERFSALPEIQQALHRKAFTTNRNDPAYHRLTELDYDDQGRQRTMKVPAGDVFHQFREDVSAGRLPAVSWLVAPENFSDHPGAPWYGAWYVSETLDILTQNPDVWKKTVFILCYDENDGYFDHVPPFTAPDPGDTDTGRVSAGVDAQTDYITAAQAQALKGKPRDPKTSGPVGLGFRVPLVVASPWSRGGWVNSQVFDHTSILQLVERWLSRKTGKTVRETNISSWRRTVTGDLSSVFRPYRGERLEAPAPVSRDALFHKIYNARYKKLPAGFSPLTPEAVAAVNSAPAAFSAMPRQERGTRPSSALPYELYADGWADMPTGTFRLTLTAANRFFKGNAAGAPFTVYSLPGFSIRNYAVAAGDTLTEILPLEAAAGGAYHFRVSGPNGFFREFAGRLTGPPLALSSGYESVGGKATGTVTLTVANPGGEVRQLTVRDESYGEPPLRFTLEAGEKRVLRLRTQKGSGWYDFSVVVEGAPDFRRRYAGRVETGAPGVSDPAMA